MPSVGKAIVSAVTLSLGTHSLVGAVPVRENSMGGTIAKAVLGSKAYEGDERRADPMVSPGRVEPSSNALQEGAVHSDGRLELELPAQLVPT
eukprot:1148834-Pleurochrysis_carterae.AAC.1